MDLPQRISEFPEAREAQAEASRYFVNMVELHHAVGRRLAELTGAESGVITSAPREPWPLPPQPAWPEAIRKKSGNCLIPPD